MISDDPSRPPFMDEDDPFDLKNARERAREDRPFSSEAGLDEPVVRVERVKKTTANFLIPETLDGSEIEDFLLAMAHKYPRRMKKFTSLMEWLIAEGQKGGVW